MVHKKLLLHILAKLDWIVILIASMTGFVMASTPDTVYITTSGSTLTITQSGTVLTQGTTTAYATSTAATIFSPAKVAILNNSTTVRSWNFPDYIFKINGSVVSTTATFVSGVTALNPGNIKSMKLLKEYQVVTALPSPLETGVTYLVGAQTSISITGLDGNSDQMYQIEASTVNAGSQDTHWMRFNNISTGVYDFRYSYAGSTSTTTANAGQIFISPNQGNNSISLFTMVIDAKTGKNRSLQGQFTPVGGNQQTIASLSLFSGVWRDSSTNLTSIQFGYASITGGYGVGTRIRIFSLQP